MAYDSLPHGSILKDPAVAQALQGVLQTPPAELPASLTTLPYGSIYKDARVAQALQGVIETPPAELPASESRLPFASIHKDQAVAQALEGVAQAQAGPVTLYIEKTNFNGGEVSPEITARHELPRFASGCHSLLNMLPLTTGGITKRPPLNRLRVLSSQQNCVARLIPFVYSSSKQAMLIMMSEGGAEAKLYKVGQDGGSWDVSAVGDLPYCGSEVNEVSVCQCGRVLYLAHHNHAPRKLDCTNYESNGPDFQISVPSFAISTPAPEWAPDCWGYGSWDNEQCVNSAYVMTAINPVTGEESLPGEPFDIYAPPATIWHQDIRPGGDPPGGLDVKEYRIYRKKGGVFGFVGRLLTDQMEFFTDDGITPDCGETPPENPENTFSRPGDYPSVVFIHQQRLGWAASDNEPLTIWMSKTSEFENRSAKTPPLDDDAIEATLASTQANRIMWCISDRTGLAVGTEGAEWYLTGADGGPAVTPNSLNFQAQTNYGSQEGVQPVKAGPNLIFCQSGGKQVRDIGYSFQHDRYEASNLNLFASHLFRFTRIRNMAWQSDPESVLWVVTTSGQLLGCTYLPEHEVIAWHRHSTPGGAFESVASINDSEGRPRLWTIVRRTGEGGFKYCLELMEPRFQGQRDPEWDKAGSASSSQYLDCGSMAYPARCVPILPELAAQDGSTFMRLKKINAIKARVIHSNGFSAQVKSQDLPPSPLLPVSIRRPGYAEWADWSGPLDGGFREGARLELVFDGPLPVTLLAIVVSMDVATTGGGQ